MPQRTAAGDSFAYPRRRHASQSTGMESMFNGPGSPNSYHDALFGVAGAKRSGAPANREGRLPSKMVPRFQMLRQPFRWNRIDRQWADLAQLVPSRARPFPIRGPLDETAPNGVQVDVGDLGLQCLAVIDVAVVTAA